MCNYNFVFMEKKLAEFIGENNFRFKLRLAEVIAREMNVKMPKSPEDMTVAEILAVSPKMQEWILYRLLWLYGHCTYVTEIQDDLRQNTNYGEAVDFGSMVLRVVYSHFKGLKEEHVSFRQYCEALAKTKFFRPEENVLIALSSCQKWSCWRCLLRKKAIFLQAKCWLWMKPEMFLPLGLLTA